MSVNYSKVLAAISIDLRKIKAAIKLLKIRPVLKDGIDGKRGFTGPEGKIGPEGIPGKDGKPGDAGKDGLMGKDGLQGLPGPNGNKGDIGDEGKSGDRGFQGLHGDRGKTGPIGPQGKTGPKGDKGDKGVSVTQIALENNMLFVWLDGVRRKIGNIKIPDTSVFIPGGGGRGKPGKNGGVRHTVANNDPTPWTIANNRQATVHGELILEGDVILENSAQLILEI